MTVKQLREKLEKMPDDLIVTICDYDNDDDEKFHFKEADGAERVESLNKRWCSVYVYKQAVNLGLNSGVKPKG